MTDGACETQDPEPAGLGIAHLPLEDDEEPRQQSSLPNSVIYQLFERLTTVSNQLEFAIAPGRPQAVSHGCWRRKCQGNP